MKSQLLALVAGNALSENVVHHVGVDGIGFRPSAEHGSLLVSSGVDAAVPGAVRQGEGRGFSGLQRAFAGIFAAPRAGEQADAGEAS
jgi:hypothetical protein